MALNRRKFLRSSAAAVAGVPFLPYACGTDSGNSPVSSSKGDRIGSLSGSTSRAASSILVRNIHEDVIDDPMVTLIAGMQGICSRKSRELVWMETRSWVNWVEYLVDRYGLEWRKGVSPTEFLGRHWVDVNTYILFDMSRNPASRNAAVSLAGILDAIPVDVSLVPYVEKHGYTEILDVRRKDENWVWNNFGTQFNRGYLFEMDPGTRGFLSDFAVYNRSFQFHNGFEISPLADSVLRSQTQGGYVMGWRGCEYDFFNSGSKAGVNPIPCPDMPNLSVLSQIDVGPFVQSNRRSAFSFNSQVHYVSFVVIDGDNIEWYYHMMATPTWWGHRARGRFPINWEISPSLYKFAGPIMQYYYESASANDFFIGSSSGQGSIFPQRHPNLAGFLETLNPMLKSADLSIISAYEPDGLNLNSLTPYTSLDAVEGVIFKSYLGNYHLVQGVEIVNGKPIKGVDYSLWFGDETGDTLAGKVNQRARVPGQDPNSYTLVAVHPWSPNIMDEMDKAVTLFDPSVKVVSCQEMFYHLKTHFRAPFASVSTCQNRPPDISKLQTTDLLQRTEERAQCVILTDPC